MILISLKPGERIKINGPATIWGNLERGSRIAVDAPQSTRVVKLMVDGKVAFPSPAKPKQPGGETTGR